MTATLNVTYAGQSRDVGQLDSSTSDDEVRRIATEAMALEPGSLDFYVVDRFPDTDMIYLRPKVPFGS